VATVNAQPDLGSAEVKVKISFITNGRYDVYNATRNNTLVAVGNEVDTKRISGKVDVVGTNRLQDVQGLLGATYIEALAAKMLCWVSRWHL